MSHTITFFEQTKEALEASLRADKVLTSEQIKRHFPQALDYAKAYPNRVVHVSATKRGPERRVRFYGLDQAALQQEASTLRHLVLAAELRLSQGIPPTEWKNEADVASLEKPDALWTPPGAHGEAKPVPVEIDIGTYSRERIRHKLLHYDRRYGSQLWGTTSASRMSMIHDMATELQVHNYRLILLNFP